MSNIILKSVACSLCILNTLNSVTSSVVKSPRPSSVRHVMKAIRINKFGDSTVLELEEIEIPKPSDQQVLVKMKAAGVNPIDVYIRERAFGFTPRLPFIIGKEAAGVVVDIGSDVYKYKKGDRVICCLPFDGGYAEYITCNSNNLIPLSDKLNFSQGAAIYVAYFTAYRSLVTKCKIKPGELALIHGGSGAVGIAAIQLAKSRGLTVVATASTRDGLKLVKQVGADIAVNHRDKYHLQEALTQAERKGFDVILENKACANLFADLHTLQLGGRIAIVGSGGSIDLNPKALISNEGQVFGVKMNAVTEEDFREYAEALKKGMEDGWVNPVIEKEYQLEDARHAHDDIMDRHGAKGKLVLVVDN